MTRIAPDIRAVARRLRAAMTPEERLLWGTLRDLNRLIGTNFRRQAPVGRFILDFADYGRRIAIELDGSQHGTVEGAALDRVRDEWLAGQGFTLLRFWNREFRENADGVMQAILDAVEVANAGPVPRRPPPHPSPRGGGSRGAGTRLANLQTGAKTRKGGS